MLTLDKVFDASNVLKEVIRPTACIHAPKVNPDCDVYLKTENLQVTGSFKVRGAYYKISQLSDEEKSHGVIACSAGNHAQGVALAATKNGIKSIICLPDGAPISKVEATKGYGAEVCLVPGVYDDAYAKAIELRDANGYTFIHPFDDENVIAGQGTIGLEILSQVADADVIVVPVGGGGLISGVAFTVKQLKPSVRVYGVQAEGAPSMVNSLKDGKIECLESVHTIADGIKVKEPGEHTFEYCSKYVDGVVTVSDDEISSAILHLIEKQVSNTMLALTAQGKNVVTSRHLFGNTFTLLAQSLRRFGVSARLCDLTRPDEVRAAIDENTCCIFLEIITNPQMEVADLQAIAAIAHEQHVPLVADTTTIPFTQFSAKDLGVDIEVVSSTKYVSGGATSLGGLIIDYGTFRGFDELVRGEMLFNFGAYMTPQVAFMQTIGLETLDARYRVQSANALSLAKKLTTLPKVKRVNYVGLEDNPYHELAQRQFGPTAGAMVCMDLEDRDACFDFIDRLKLIHRATNLFDNRTLAIHPASTIFGLFSAKQKERMDVLETTIRLSIGLEDVDDLFDDIKQALGY